MRHCTECGNLIGEGDDYCSRCGKRVRGERGATNAKRVPEASTTSSGLGGAAVFLGLVGAILGFLFIPFIGITLGIVAMALGGTASIHDEKNGDAGAILGGLAVILSILGWMIGIRISL